MLPFLRRLMRLAGPYVVFGVGMWLAPMKQTDEYFAVNAQVIPVLLLVLAWDANAFRWRTGLPPDTPADDESRFLFVTRAAVFLAMVVAEIVSLRGLGGVHISELGMRVIFGSILAGLGGIAALTILSEREDTSAAAGGT